MQIPQSCKLRFMQKTSAGFLAVMIMLSYSLAGCGSDMHTHPPVCSTTGTHDRQIIFLHGVNQNASLMGVIQNPTANDIFVPLLESLQCVYNPADIHIFQYLDDQALAAQNGGACPATISPPCVSQGAVGDNAVQLSTMVSSLSQRANQKVTVIAYSMGGAITRSMLAGCPSITPDAAGNPQTLSGCNVASMVSDVFFINVPQQGSYLLALKQSLDTSNNPIEIALGWAAYAIAKGTMGLVANDAAEVDMTPGSPNIILHNQNLPPGGNIHYFNFFGDIQIHPISNLLDLIIPGASSATIAAGDLVILPGVDDPQAVPAAGGSRFCLACGTQDSNGYASSPDGMYSQWALTDNLSWDYSVLVQFIQSLGASLPQSAGQHLLGNILNAPETHLDIYSDDSLYNTSSIQVEDHTGRGGKTSIANEILWQLEKEDGITQ